MPHDINSAKRRILKITDRCTNETVFRTKGGTGIQWASCTHIDNPFKPAKPPSDKPDKPGKPGNPKPPASNAIKQVYYISFNNTFFATINIAKNELTADQIIAQGRALFNIGKSMPVFVSFTKPCKAGVTY